MALQNLPNLPWLFVLLFGVPGLFCLVWRRVDRARFETLRRVGARAGGTVVGRGTVVDHGEEQGFDVIFVEFRDGSGTRHRVRSRGGSSLFPGPGAYVDVFYDPARPERARIRDDYENGQLVLAILGVAFSAVAVLALVAGAITLLFI